MSSNAHVIHAIPMSCNPYVICLPLLPLLPVLLQSSEQCLSCRTLTWFIFWMHILCSVRVPIQWQCSKRAMRPIIRSNTFVSIAMQRMEYCGASSSSRYSVSKMQRQNSEFILLTDLVTRCSHPLKQICLSNQQSGEQLPNLFHISRPIHPPIGPY